MLWYLARRALRRGYRAWLVGNLDEALRRLEEARRLRPRHVGATYYLARALSESGRFEDAMAAIDSAIELDPGGLVGRVFRAIIVSEHRPSDAGREALAPLEGQNLVARALLRLSELSERLASRPDPDAPVAAELPLAARWMPEVSGRALSILEDRFLRLPGDEWIPFHHALLDTRDPSLSPPPATFRSAKEWERRVTDTFRGCHYAAVESLCDRKEARDWMTPAVACHRAFALLAIGRAREAQAVSSEALAADPVAGDLHLIRGLCHAKMGGVRGAGWAFTRWARLMDTDVDDVLKEVSRRLGVSWTYVDP